MTFRKYLVLGGITLFAALGDSLLSHGMKEVGSISLNHWSSVLTAVFNPWVALGIVFLLFFFVSYTTALSWADLTYVLPASSLGYVLLALIAKFALHEKVSIMRWLGIAIVSRPAAPRADAATNGRTRDFFMTPSNGTRRSAAGPSLFQAGTGAPLPKRELIPHSMAVSRKAG